MLLGQSGNVVYIDETRNVYLIVVGKPLVGGCVTKKHVAENMKTDLKNVSC
jgi:hypothetical protein